MTKLVCLVVLSLSMLGCSHSAAPSYSDRSMQIEKEFTQAYANGSVAEVEKALHVYLHRLDEVERHPKFPEGKEVHLAFLRGLAEARLARLHKLLGHPQKEQAFVAVALTHVADANVNTEADLFEMVKRFDGERELKWKQEITQPPPAP
jgi:hypothetical protein